MMAAWDWIHTVLDAPGLVVRDQRAGHGRASLHAVEITVAVVASALMAIMVAVGGSAVQVTGAAALPTGGVAAPDSELYPDAKPDGRSGPDAEWSDPMPGGKEVFRTPSRSVIDPAYTPEGEKIPSLATPKPDPMVWCRPLDSWTICIREGT